MRTGEYLGMIGVAELAPRTCPFDPGYDPVTVEAHLEQSAHLMASLKISMACWQIAEESATRRKVEAARRSGVPACTGGGPFEVAVAMGRLPEYLDLCAEIGMSRVEAGEGFTDLPIKPSEAVRTAAERGLELQFEVGKKHAGSFTGDVVLHWIDEGKRWLDAGARQIVIEARESAQGVGLFDQRGRLDGDSADRFVKAFGLDRVIFEAPTKQSQFALLVHFGPQVYLGNVRLEELLRVEIFRRGLHSDAFQHGHLRPKGPSAP